LLVFRLQDGKIKEIREYCDSVLTERALGRFAEGEKRRRSDDRGRRSGARQVRNAGLKREDALRALARP
jgi:hypothetical protein